MNSSINQKKTIALVANTSWSIYNFRLGLLRHLRQKGYRIVVIAPKDAFTSKIISEGFEYNEIEISNYGTNPFRDLLLIYDLVKLYQKIQPDLIFHYTIKPNIFGTFAALYCKVPSIIITTGLGHLFEFKNFIVRNITLILYKLACKYSMQTWFLNSNDRDVFVYNNLVAKSKAVLLKSEGIDLEWFKNEYIVAPGSKSEVKFLFAGRLLRDKGIIEYIEAAKIIKANYPNVVFQILGFIDQSNPNSIPYEYLQLWQEQKLVSYLGETTDVRPYLQDCDALVFPSFYREGISRILMEAAAMERPIITTENVGCREVVDHRVNGFLCEPKNVVSLVKYIEKFLEMNVQDRDIMGKLGRRKMYREFNQRLIFSQYEKCIISIIGPASQASKSKNYMDK